MEHGERNQDDNIPSPSAGKSSCKLKKVKEDKGLKSRMDMSKSNLKKIITKSKPQQMKVSSSIFAKKVSQKYNVNRQNTASAILAKERFCKMCELQFGTIRLYTKHMKSKHPNQYKEEPELITVIQKVNKLMLKKYQMMKMFSLRNVLNARKSFQTNLTYVNI